LDVNILLDASNADAPEHERAVALLRHLAAGPELVVVLWPTVMSYLRISTHPSVFSRPLAHTEAVANIEAFVSRPHVRLAAESPRFWEVYRHLAHDVPPRGNGVLDAHLVALMVDHGVDIMWSRDRDFRKYPGIVLRDPFADGFAAGFAPARAGDS